jgi:hypothetical protein
MTTKTETTLVAWNGETYKGAGDYFDRIRADEVFDELGTDEAIRLAIYAYNCHADINGLHLYDLLEEEREAFAGENTSEADFAQELVEEVDGYLFKDLPSWVVIDWQATWDSALRFDYFTFDVIDTDGDYKRFFWRAY